MRTSARRALLLAAAGVLTVAPAAMAAAEEAAPAPAQATVATSADQVSPSGHDELKQWLRQQKIQSLATRPQRGLAAGARDDPPRKPPARPPKLKCTQAAVGAYVRRYTVAFNRGKAKRLKRFFTRTSVPVARGEEGGLVVLDGNARGFRWYTVSATRRGLTKSARGFFLGRTRSKVLRYISVRRTRAERLRFVTVTGFEPLEIGGAPHAGVAFLVRRRAGDLLPRKRWRTLQGKALIDCQSGRISAFSI
ncbi:MAG: hypothetical protein OEM67_04200 [Thermoleophilia bacterium]|nr:hypothetical protein [Thermoleophilia bacterium]MDH3724204.1 hypothetical protein [Thermoleophilia bacterium]